MDIEIRPIADEDIEAYFHMMNDPTLAINTATVPHPITLDWARERILKRRADEAEGKLAQRGLYEGGVLVGDIAWFKSADGEVEIGYAIAKEHRGRGLATLAVALILDLLRDGGYRGEVVARYAKDNPASGRVLEKAGFRPAGEGVGTSLARGGQSPHWRVVREL